MCAVCLTGLAVYLVSRQLVQFFLRQLKLIESWFISQRSYHFIASSLLFVYDVTAVSHQTHSSELDQSDDSNHSSRLADLKMIDFTHVFPATDLDSNYLFGLRSLIAYLTRLEEPLTSVK